jgi:hypothetical protein
MVKYAADEDKPRIRECFESIPKQLAKDNKKFQYSIVRKGGRSKHYIGSIQWLEDAGIAKRCYNTKVTELPLEGNAVLDCFKLYTTDIGMLVSMLDYGTQADILKGNLLGYKGAIFENLVADFLCKSGQKLYYFQKDSGLELDFLVRYRGECVVIEVKAKSFERYEEIFWRCDIGVAACCGCHLFGIGTTLLRWREVALSCRLSCQADTQYRGRRGYG